MPCGLGAEWGCVGASLYILPPGVSWGKCGPQGEAEGWEGAWAPPGCALSPRAPPVSVSVGEGLRAVRELRRQRRQRLHHTEPVRSGQRTGVWQQLEVLPVLPGCLGPQGPLHCQPIPQVLGPEAVQHHQQRHLCRLPCPRMELAGWGLLRAPGEEGTLAGGVGGTLQDLLVDSRIGLTSHGGPRICPPDLQGKPPGQRHAGA